MVDDGKTTAVAVKETVSAAYARSPDGAATAYGKPNALVFHDLRTGKVRAVA